MELVQRLHFRDRLRNARLQTFNGWDTFGVRCEREANLSVELNASQREAEVAFNSAQGRASRLTTLQKVSQPLNFGRCRKFCWHRSCVGKFWTIFNAASRAFSRVSSRILQLCGANLRTITKWVSSTPLKI